MELLARRGAGPGDADVQRLLKASGGHRKSNAQQLGVGGRALYRYLKRLRNG